MTLLECNDLIKLYTDESSKIQVPALRGVELTANEGDLVSIIGPSGSGKSTLIKLVAGVLPPTSGEVRIFGSRPRGHICIGYIPQRSQVDWNFPVTVADVVMMGRSAKLGPLNFPHKKDSAFSIPS